MTRVMIIIFSITTFFLIGCNRTRKCSNTFITPAFIGFSVADLDTIVVRKFKKDGNFSNSLDTAIITLRADYLASATSHDTTIVLVNHISGQEKHVFPDNDWQIYVPAQNKTVSISNIVSPETETSCFNCDCSNPINSFLQNGVLTVPQIQKIPFYGNGYLTYIPY